MRERDAARINEAVLTIVADGAERMAALRKAGIPPTGSRELDSAVEVVDWGIRTFASYVGESVVCRGTISLISMRENRMDRH